MAPLQLQKTFDHPKVLKFPHFDTLDFWFGNNRCRWPSKSRLCGNISPFEKSIRICLGGKALTKHHLGNKLCTNQLPKSNQNNFVKSKCCCASIESFLLFIFYLFSSSANLVVDKWDCLTFGVVTTDMLLWSRACFTP